MKIRRIIIIAGSLVVAAIVVCVALVSHMKLIAHLTLVALLPFLSGCLLSRNAIQAAKDTTSQIHNKVANIEKAAVTKDGQLCIFFESDLTNSAQKTHFTLVFPLAQIQTNAQDHRVGYVGDRHYSFTYGTLHVPGNTIRAHWTLLESPETNLIFVQVGTPIIVGERDDTFRHDQKFILLPNATQTVYLTRTTPIEFVYVDASIKRPFTIVTVDPTVITEHHLGYYALLPLTVPADVVLFPFEAILIWGVAMECHQ